MRRSRNLLFLMLLSLIMCMACEKPIEDEQEKDNKELYIDDDDDIIDDNSDGDDKKDSANPDDEGGSGGSNGDDGNSGGSEDDDNFTEDPSKTDNRDTPYNETDIVDGNADTNNGGNTGSGNTGDNGADGNTGDSSGGNTGGGSNSDTTYTTGDTINVVQFINVTSAKYLYVKGYIVGCATRNATKSENVDLDAPFKYATALLLADSPNERNVNNMMSVELKSGSKIRETLNLVDHEDMYKRKVLIGGYRETYLYIPGIKGSNDFKIYK